MIGTPGIDDEAVEEYLTYGSVPPPLTLFKGIRKLAPGTALRIGRDGKLRSEVYWALPAEQQGAMLDGELPSARWTRSCSDAVALRLVADVPVGAYLSGGLGQQPHRGA